MFRSAVRELRLERRLTQEDVARRGDLGLKYLGQLERGELVPKLPSMVGIANGLGMSLAELFRALADRFAAAESS